VKDALAFARQFDATLVTGNIQRLYGDTGYFNVGYWTPDTPDLRAACDRLVDEVLEAVPASSHWILDTGCGLGSGTRRIGERRPDASVLAGNISLWQLTRARERGVAPAVVMDAARLPVRSGALDAVVAIESPQHFDTRAAFLAEAFRALRPGGVLSMTDMLFSDADVIGPWMIPHLNRLTSLTAYEQVLRDSGFTEITVEDVTGVTWRPFCRVMRTAFGGDTGRVDAIEGSVSHYLLVRASRPGA
jgi:SAM-dependent methyltransferase